MSDILKDVVLWCQYAASGNPNTRYASYGIHRGHFHYMDKNIRPCMAYSNDELNDPLAVLGHLPFGKTQVPGTNHPPLMALNEYQLARKLGFPQHWRNFADAYGPAIEEGFMEYTPYLGNFDHIRVNDYREHELCLEIALQNLQPVFDAGMTHVCFDAQSWDRTIASEYLFQAAEYMGLTCLTEATPPHNHPRYDNQAVVMDTLWLNRHDPVFMTDSQSSIEVLEVVGEEMAYAQARTWPAIGDEDWYKHPPIVLIRAGGSTTIQARRWINLVRDNGCIAAIPIGMYKRIMREEGGN